MNITSFLEGQHEYFGASYDEFEKFGGPGVYFHLQCLRAAQDAFLSLRHVETLYATLTAWGMHRMGGSDKTKTKLTSWDRFHGSISANRTLLEEFRSCTMLGMAEDDYVDAVARLRHVYEKLDLTESEATVVVNSKALHHLFPEFIPPIDRQYTIRFLTQTPDRWRGGTGKYRLIPLPPGLDAQFARFTARVVS